MTLRRLLFWLHLGTGISVGLILAFLAVTGATISFQSQLISAAEAKTLITSPATGACVPPSALLATAASQAQRPLTSLTLFTDPHRPAQIAVGTGGAVLLADRCTGRILGPGANRLRVFLTATRELHHHIALSGVRHETLNQIKNAAVLGFAFLLVSGLYLWFPRKRTWAALRPSVLFRPGLHGRAREWNLHNIVGLWLALPLFSISATGIIMAYPWANALLFRAAGEAPPPPRAAEASPTAKAHRDRTPGPHRASSDSGRAGETASPSLIVLDAPIARALAQTPTPFSVTLRLPPLDAARAPGTLTFQLDPGQNASSLRRDQLTLATADSSVVRFEPSAAATRGRRWRFYVRYLHTGELFGVPGQAVALLSVLGLLALVYTGFALALRRLLAFRRRHKPAGLPAKSSPEPDNVLAG